MPLQWLRTLASGAGRAPSRASGLALITANFGGIDDIKPFPKLGGVDAYYYTQAETLAAADAETAATWTRIVLPDYPRHDFGPRLRARYFKHQIHRLPEAEKYRRLVWADANVRFKDPSFLLRAAAKLAACKPHKRVAVIPHPHRATVRQEYEFIRDRIAGGDEYLALRYGQEKMDEQMRFFVSRGWNLDAPLLCGTVWMMENNETIRRCWDAWWDQNLRYGMMDQLSLPVLLDVFGLKAHALDFDLAANPFFDWCGHQKLM